MKNFLRLLQVFFLQLLQVSLFFSHLQVIYFVNIKLIKSQEDYYKD